MKILSTLLTLVITSLLLNAHADNITNTQCRIFSPKQNFDKIVKPSVEIQIAKLPSGTTVQPVVFQDILIVYVPSLNIEWQSMAPFIGTLKFLDQDKEVVVTCGGE